MNEEEALGHSVKLEDVREMGGGLDFFQFAVAITEVLRSGTAILTPQGRKDVDM